MRAIRVIGWSSYLQTLSFLRVKEALFFSLAFPIFLFLLFGYIWGGLDDLEYVEYLFTGILGMTIANDALYGFGPIVKNLRTNNLLKVIKCTPIPVMYHFTGLFLSRVSLMLFTYVLLLLTAGLTFSYLPTSEQVFLHLAGVALGSVTFALLSLLLTLPGRKGDENGFLNFLFFFMLFTCGAFFQISETSFLYSIASVLPLTHLVAFLRGETGVLLPLIAWMVVSFISFALLFRRTQVYR
ncbi:hypothetical protein QWY85_08555 [Neolewinella lacunae]|uniref:ABC-2 type transporter transmembrane domain-containing protein n=1 Tax=Neolewinella lacunae TaxID=1517758 RepID=A0A923PH91_9BACT|nr:ABC transporter permease [Neolewinella lacunae]MBC6994035.1 hypothetical protein [Neolewinella lacunae]MDN3634705.1 hypothetical protein [Neolewinella lacunae]